MIVRTRAGHQVRVPASAGDHAELRIQDRYAVAVIASGEAEAIWPASATVGLHWGRRLVIRGEVWINKARHTLEVTR